MICGSSFSKGSAGSSSVRISISKGKCDFKDIPFFRYDCVIVTALLLKSDLKAANFVKRSVKIREIL